MNFDMPKAVFCALDLIAAAIFFGPGSHVATASGGIQKIALCDRQGRNRWEMYGMWKGYSVCVGGDVSTIGLSGGHG